MKISPQCMLCLLRKQEGILRKQPDYPDPVNYMKNVMKIIIEASDDDTMPWIADRIQKYASSQFPEERDYALIKSYYNEQMIKQEDLFWETIQKADDPLSYAIRLARCGNYIDFGAMESVDDDVLADLLQRVANEELDPILYEKFQKQMAQATSFVYLCDNCGEIVLDKLLIRLLLKRYPNTDIKVMVRGGEVINDATMMDVQQIHLDSLVPCIDSGVPLAGCDLRHISRQARMEIENADMILAKGQANFESLYGHNLPIYYLFLCKCEYFTQRFHMKRLEGVFTNEDALHDII